MKRNGARGTAPAAASTEPDAAVLLFSGPLPPRPPPRPGAPRRPPSTAAARCEGMPVRACCRCAPRADSRARRRDLLAQGVPNTSWERDSRSGRGAWRAGSRCVVLTPWRARARDGVGLLHPDQLETTWLVSLHSLLAASRRAFLRHMRTRLSPPGRACVTARLLQRFRLLCQPGTPLAKRAACWR